MLSRSPTNCRVGDLIPGSPCPHAEVLGKTLVCVNEVNRRQNCEALWIKALFTVDEVQKEKQTIASHNYII